MITIEEFYKLVFTDTLLPPFDSLSEKVKAIIRELYESCNTKNDVDDLLKRIANEPERPVNIIMSRYR